MDEPERDFTDDLPLLVLLDPPKPSRDARGDPRTPEKTDRLTVTREDTRNDQAPRLLRRVRNWFPNDYDGKSLLFSSGKLPNAEFFLYLRHHGFPSPLLDWTRSPYVGAFFAFAERSSAPTRAIYVWQKPDVWSGGTDEPEIHRIGPYIRAHPRHVFQQSEYTYGVRYETASKRWFFVPQHDALSAPVSPPQCLWRFILPSTERTKVLEFLHSCNVTPHSLFGTDDGLMETLGLREFDLKG